MKKILLLLALPLLAHASNQDQLIAQDMEISRVLLTHMVSEAHKNGANLTLRTSRELGTVLIRFYDAQIRSAAVYTSAEDKKLADGIAYVTELLSKGTNSYSGLAPASISSDVEVGVFDEKFYSMMKAGIDTANTIKAKVLARAQTSPSMEYFERNLISVANKGHFLEFMMSQAMTDNGDLPNKAAQLCYFGGLIDVALSQFESDLNYLVSSGAPVQEARQTVTDMIHAPRYSETFCGYASGKPMAQIRIGQSSQALTDAVTSDFQKLQSVIAVLNQAQQ